MEQESFTVAQQQEMPCIVAALGGSGVHAGVFCADLNIAPSASAAYRGFRCCSS